MYFNTAPAVTAVITTHNRPEWLVRAVRSVLAQTCPVDEIIVVDDGSRMDVKSVIEALGDPRVRFLRHRLPRGGSAARNTGIEAASTPFIAFLDDDDTWSPAKIEKQLDVFSQNDPEIGGVFCYSCKLSPIDPDWVQVAETPRLRLTFADFLGKTFFGASVPLLRLDCLEKVGGFDESLLSVQDRDVWLKITRDYVFEGVPEVLVQNYIHGAQISSDLLRKIAGREKILEKYLGDLLFHPSILLGHYWSLGLMHCINGSYEAGRSRLRQAIAIDPSNAGPQKDLQWSEQAPAEHAQNVLQERFNRVGDVVLYY